MLLGGCLVAGGIVSRFGQSPMLGYLLAGMLLGGPGSFHLVGSEHEIEAIAELGVALLLFGIGLEFSWRRLRSLGGAALAAGAAQVVLTCAGGALVSAVFGLGAIEAFAVGAMIALSSTAAVLRVLMDRAEIDSSHGRDALAVLLVQDIAVVPLAVLLTVLSGGGAVGEVLLELGRILLLAAGLILALYVLLNVVAVWALGRLTIERNRELTVLLAIGTGLGSAYAAHAVGISPAMGAFVSGMFLGGSRFATQIRADVASLRVVLLTLFFGAAGMVADPIWIGQHALLVLGVTVLLVAGKAAIVWLVLGWAGRPTATAIASGLCLAQVGEFAFVLGSIGQHAGAVGESTYLLVVSCAITTLFLTPFVVPWAPTIGLRVARALGRRDPDASGVASGREPPTVVIVGFGPAGRLAAQALAGGNERVLVIDLNDTSRAAVEALGFQVEIGDARQFDVLEHARVEHAHTIVITVPDRSSALTILHHMHRMAPQATIIVRARYEQHRADFENACAHVVVGDEERVGTALADRIRGELPTRPAADAPTVG